MSYVYLGVMILSFIGVIVCSKKQQANPAVQPVMLGLVILMLVMGGLWFFTGGEDAEATDWDQEFYASRGYVLGGFLEANYSGETVLLCMNQGEVNGNRYAKFRKLLEENFSGTIIDAPFSIDDEAEAEKRDAARLDAFAVDFADLLNEHSDCRVIVSGHGFPVTTFKKLPNAKDKAKHPVFVVTGGSNNGIQLRKMFKDGWIVGYFSGNRNADYDNPPVKGDYQATFDMRYVLVDKDNYKDDEMMPYVGK